MIGVSNMSSMKCGDALEGGGTGSHLCSKVQESPGGIPVAVKSAGELELRRFQFQQDNNTNESFPCNLTELEWFKKED